MGRVVDPSLAAAVFSSGFEVVGIEPYEQGHIHRAFKVTLRTDHESRALLLQRINHQIFRDPATLMRNVRNVTTFYARWLAENGIEDADRRTLALVETEAGSTLWRDPDGWWWRAYRFIEGASRARSSDAAHVEGAARAFGEFQRVLVDYDGEPLRESIPDFHDTPLRLEALERAAAEDPCGRLREVLEETEKCLEQRPLASALAVMQRPAGLAVRVVHNDAKLDNVLFDTATGEPLCVVDLDTVGPGFAAFDFGDMVRSMSSGCAEDEPDPSGVTVREELFTAIVGGYLSPMGEVLSPAELRSLVPGCQVLTLEQAARFLTDYLLGDIYYRIDRQGQNLDRARVHLSLLKSLIDKGPRLERIIAGCCPP